MKLTHTVLRSVALILALVTVACGGRSASSPVAPTLPGAAPPTGSTAGAVIAGTIVGGGGGGITASSFRPLGGGPMTVTIVGSPVTSAVDTNGAFTLQGVPAGDVQLQISGPGFEARVVIAAVGEHEQIRITIRVNGSSADLDEHARETDNRVEIEGRVTQVNVSARTLRVADNDISVPAGTTIRHGGTTVPFSEIQVGDRVHVRGTRTGSMVVATEIELQTSNPGRPAEEEVELKGTVAGRTGTCPVISFTLAGKKIVTNGSTQFHDGTCAQVTNGASVEAKGRMQSDGSVLATRIELDQPEQKEAEVEGVLSNRAGACPSITFIVASKAVATNAATEFKDGSCAGLANGDRVEVEGIAQANGSILAKRVEKKK